MPVPVDRVPDAWEPYMDGRIWRFTESEFRKMPTFGYTTDEDGLPVGQRAIYWHQGEIIYVRFYEYGDQRTIEQLAGRE